MKNIRLLPLLAILIFTFIACSDDVEDLPPPETTISTIRTELEQVMADNDVERLWAVSFETCPSVVSYSGTKDFEFLEFFIRIQDRYYQYDRLVSFQTEGFQMLLCFD